MRSPQEILDVARSKWSAVLRAEAAGESMFPLAIPFGRPSTTSDFGAIRADLTSLANADIDWTIDWEEIDTRKWGNQRWPLRVSFDSIESLARALRSTEQLKLLREALVFARSVCPKLEPWLQTKAHKIPELLPDWKQLVSVCAFFDANPFPNCFARQLPIPVGTKFVEEHKGIVAELLTVVLGDRANALAILGSGKAASLLSACRWLHESDVVYWGDCDEAGFGILSSLRARLPRVRSMLMDDETWKCWKQFAVPGKRDPGARYDHLTANETEALAAVMASSWMLEQERIPVQDVENAIQNIFWPAEPEFGHS